MALGTLSKHPKSTLVMEGIHDVGDCHLIEVYQFPWGYEWEITVFALGGEYPLASSLEGGVPYLRQDFAWDAANRYLDALAFGDAA